MSPPGNRAVVTQYAINEPSNNIAPGTKLGAREKTANNIATHPTAFFISIE